MVNPKAAIIAKAPTRESGIATIGTSTDRKDPMKRKITSATMSSVSVRVFTISLSASSMYLLAS